MIDKQDQQGIRNYVHSKFNVELTDSQWQIVFDEVDNREPDELISDVLDSVVPNIKDYEDEPAFLEEMRVAIANGEQKQFLEKHFGKY